MNIEIEMVIWNTVVSILQTIDTGFLLMLAPFAHMSWTIPIILLICALCLFIRVPFLARILIVPYRFVVRMLRLMGVLHDRQTWGVVYDSVTKDPIDPAYVSVLDRWGKVIATAVTDLDGRFGIIVPKGTYRLIVEKANYNFPSTKLVGKETDGYYSGLYFGNQIQILENEQALAFSVPLDPASSDWNQAEKKRRNISLNTRRRSEYQHASYGYYFVIGILIVCRYIATGDAQTYGFLKIYAAIFAVGFIGHLFRSRSYYHSVVIEKKTNLPLGFARIKVFRNNGHVQVASKATSYNGQFVCLIPNGKYYVTVDRRNPDGTYTLVHTSGPFDVFQGVDQSALYGLDDILTFS